MTKRKKKKLKQKRKLIAPSRLQFQWKWTDQMCREKSPKRFDASHENHSELTRNGYKRRSKEKRQRKNYLKFTSDKCKNAALKERRTGTLNDWDVTECRQMNVCSNALYISYMYYFCQVEKRFLSFSFSLFFWRNNLTSDNIGNQHKRKKNTK